MKQIIKGSLVNVEISLFSGGVAFSIPLDATVTAGITSTDGLTSYLSPIPVLSGTIGSNWPIGKIVVPLDSAQTASMPLGDVLIRISVSIAGSPLAWQIPAEVVLLGNGLPGSIFSSLSDALAMLKGDRLTVSARNFMGGWIPADATLTLKLKAAEKEVSRRLGIPLVPTEIFSTEPTESELAAISGKPYLVEPGYDLPPGMFSMSMGGSLKLRKKPVIRIDFIKIIYPTMENGFEVPKAWIQCDKRFGMVSVVPGAGMMLATPGAAFATIALSSGLNVPYMVKVRYCAGLENVEEDHPDVMDLVLRMASLKVLEDCFLPQSGSISADGLSQSISSDASKYRDSIEAQISDLKDALSGPVWGVL